MHNKTFRVLPARAINLACTDPKGLGNSNGYDGQQRLISANASTGVVVADH